VVAVAFQPVRQRIQHLANRVVYGRRATPYEVLSRFSEGLAGTSGLEDLLSRLVRLLAEGTGAKNAQVWLRVSEQLVCEAAWPPDGEHPPPTPHRGDGDPVIPVAGRVVPVRHQGELLGAVALAKAPGDLITPGDDKLLADVASQAGLVLRNVRLVEELRASRQRIVAAQDEERRRLERDIHDGAQQELVALALGIRMAETRLGGATNPKLAEALERTDQELKETLSELRELARGIHPAILTERGLEPALRMLVERSPVPVDVESSLNSRLPPTVEATAYFVVAEALQNVAKYSGASVATVRVDASASELRVEVSDDGVGGADASRGSGLRGLMDRVAAVDGVLDVESAPGRGTRLTCRIPVRSRLQPRLMQGEASESVQGAEGESVGEPALR
jgi:signal transduction histidine kinase